MLSVLTTYGPTKNRGDENFGGNFLRVYKKILISAPQFTNSFGWNI